MSERNKSHSATGEHTAEELITNIQKLMAEVEDVISRGGETVTEQASSRLEELQDRLSSASTAVQGFYRTARRKVAQGAQAADETIRARPYESLAVALGVGVLLGALLRRRD
ncbi:MAG TPA: hypothetical protein VGL42_17610 [Opitutaceae bacterium]|jgi:ElaB/YqjD/DUF883 family membrane-anchored ribosome-binding protein